MPCSPTTSMPWVLAVNVDAKVAVKPLGNSSTPVMRRSACPGPGSWRAKTRAGSSPATMREPLMQ